MPHVKPRKTYSKDAQAIARIRDAVALDADRPSEWRHKTVDALDLALHELLIAPVIHGDDEKTEAH